MAIAYLVNIDLNNNQLLDFKVYNRTSDETGLSGSGQLIYRTDTNVLKYHTGGNTWVTVGTSTDSWILNGDSGTSQTINNNDTVLITGNTYITTVVSATDTLTINHDATSRTDTASAVSPAHGSTFTVIDSVTTNATGHVTAANLKTVTLPNDNDTSLPIKNSAGTLQFTAEDVNGVRFGATGGATVTFNSATQLVTYNAVNDNETYTLPVSVGAGNSAAIDLTAGGTGSGIKSTVTFTGTAAGIAITETVGNNGAINVALQDNVDIVGTLDVTGITTLDANLIVAGSGLSTFAGQVQVPTASADTNAPNLGQVKLLIAGVGVFQGSYNASTNVPALSGASNVALDLGDYFVVSVAGNDGGYFPDLEPGDFIFANAAITASSSPAVSAYTVVQADANIAGVGATDGATQKGVAGFDSGNFAATANGWITLKNRSVAGTYGTASAVSTITTDAQGIVTAASNTAINITASQVSDFCTAVQVCVADNGAAVLIGDGTATSYAINVSALNLPTGTRDLMVQTFRNTTPWDTVYMDVERTSDVLLTLTTTTALATNAVRVLIQKIT
jgi:trimeric autotransporter adhesin